MRLPIVAGARAIVIATGLYATGLLTPAAAQGPSLAMLGALDDGQWEVRFRDGSESRRVCVRSGLELIQLQHASPGCSRFVVEDGASEVTVQYTCKGNGYGRTNIRRESNSLVQIDSQGIASGLPFEFSAEARRVGACR
ncbi:hypothetical protein A6F68_00281 [Tsuneonella dongtanensis]|uniref:DUF3617 domain-containing protein n=1 Tax=Tsuneonella dongtanensis TaxID=692370 RepID=A0A1B2A9I2_9SPHN|nr:hypothetical protein [Tsuneonella dongtanensis]ANY18816.1 hypothetical protein A6F68_00281 [Tsuneonella dongtanensis]